MAIRVTRAYRTVSTDALLVLAQLMPWPIRAKLRHEMFWKNKKLEDDELSDDDAPVKTDEQLEEEALMEWQRRWDASANGRWTHQCVPNIATWINRKFGDLNYFLTQVLTGHGDFQTYLCRIGKAPSPTCLFCDVHPEDTVEHTVMECKAFEHERRGIRAGNIPEMVSHMHQSSEAWEYHCRKIACIMKKKHVLGMERLRNFPNQ